ncbi:hypothetical protein H6G93_07080 [Nostoc sp. FACHB-973]|uniref:Cytochrome P460 domain-containing protein n=1 Tax=Desmonostoc muscorum LEGE 12446 TaxID=1828758 RepID=A0A8J7DD66_DESMC|nr:hypothetical protein [Desmonostoc muscorum]MBD2514774.1 hypothetical protein [Nostoc sp. FACHB-973]MBX9253918.1 hypothetical protein [Desmonostoc muscorum CCALA 125]MCF2148289.1 hypothetical protein [Desmonostoc muscorum LEGE 12446]
MRLRKLVSYGIFVLAVVIGLGLTTVARGYDIPPPSGKIEFAEQTSDLMLATIFAALTQEFDETTPDNVEQGKHSISLIFNDKNKDMRLVGTLEPLRENDRPYDSFERQAHIRALNGEVYTSVQRVDDQWYYRRSIPLSNFRPECALCHTNYQVFPATQQVGALMLRVPIKK